VDGVDDVIGRRLPRVVEEEHVPGHRVRRYVFDRAQRPELLLEVSRAPGAALHLGHFDPKPAFERV
jgi:hypothetical protein